MRSNFFDCWPVLSAVREEAQDEVLEVVRNVVAPQFVEVFVEISGEQHVIEFVSLSGFHEWEGAVYNCEENHANGEDVDLRALVCFSLFDFGGHVSLGTDVVSELVNILVLREAEVADLEVELLVIEYVFKLDVSVDNSLVVHIFE